MKNIIFIAPPAAGKGTMSTLLKNKYNYVHISTGDLLRDAKSKNDEFGKMLAGMLSSGKLVPDEIVLELLENRIKQDDAKRGFILDGYPRNINDYVVIYLDVDYEEAMHRTLGRMICSNCKSSFNKFKEATRPKVDGICDFCGSKLEVRADDTEETFKVRYQTYIEDTKPVLDYFKKIGKLENIKVNDNPQEMLENIEKYLEV